MPAAVLRCILAFSAWGNDYSEGGVVDPSNWPEELRKETVVNRLTNGFVEWTAGPDDAPTKEAEVSTPAFRRGRGSSSTE